MISRAGESRKVSAGSSASPPAPRALQALLFGAAGNLPEEFSRYLVVGGLAFVVDFGSLYLLTEFAGLNYLISAAIGFLFGVLTNYCLSRLWVFDRRTLENSILEFVIFSVIGIVGLGLNEVTIWFVREKREENSVRNHFEDGEGCQVCE